MEYQFIISGEIGVAFDWWTGQRGTTANQVKNFLDAHKDEDVHIAVCSPGGYVDAGLQIYQHIKNHGRVHCHIIGMTASAATILTANLPAYQEPWPCPLSHHRHDGQCCNLPHHGCQGG